MSNKTRLTPLSKIIIGTFVTIFILALLSAAKFLGSYLLAG